MKKKMVISCSKLISPFHMRALESAFDVIHVGCNSETQAVLSLPRERKIFYVLGGQERLFGELAEVVADRAEAVIFVGEQPETYIDMGLFDAKNIPVLRTGGGATAVAERTFSQIVDPQRLRDWAAKHGIWAPAYDEDAVADILKKQSLTVVGAGKIGQILLKKFQGKVRRLRYAGGHGQKKELFDLGFTYEPDLARAFDADIVSLHLSYGPGTEAIIKEEHLEKILFHGCLINNARAELVDKEGLHQALWDHPDVNFYFDVFWKEGAEFRSIEKKSLEEKIIGMPNFHFSHHSAAVADPAWRRKTIDEYGDGLLSAVAKLRSKK